MNLTKHINEFHLYVYHLTLSLTLAHYNRPLFLSAGYNHRYQTPTTSSEYSRL